MCQQNNLHTRGPEQHTEPAAPLAVFNTLFLKSVLTNFRSTYTQLSLLYSLSVVEALMQPQSVHLFHSLSLHIYLQFRAHSHMALLTLLCHTARHGACHTGVTDAALPSVCLAFPPVTQLLTSTNHSAAAQEQLPRLNMLIATIITALSHN